MLRETCTADWIVAAAGIAFVVFVLGSAWLEGKKKKRKKGLALSRGRRY